MRRRLEEFMQGRYGADEFSRFIMAVTLVLLILNMFTRIPLLYLLALVFLGYGYFRMFSRNISKRYAENQKYLALENRLRRFFGQKRYLMQQRKEYHIYKCPGCKQKIRIPRGKGKISIRCPKCGEEFIKNS